jgi:hypothetical protein
LPAKLIKNHEIAAAPDAKRRIQPVLQDLQGILTNMLADPEPETANEFLGEAAWDCALCDARGGSDGIGERHTDPVFRPQDDHRASFNGLPRSQLKIVFSEQIAQNHEDL